MSLLGPGPHTRVRRMPEKARYDRDSVFEVLDGAPFAHVTAVVEGVAVALPTLIVRDDETIYVHGSRSNAVMRAAAEAGRTLVTATILDGLRLARSGFESSIAYRSVTVVGSAAFVEDEAVRRALLERFVDAVVPGRSREVRPTRDDEVRRTAVLAVAIEEAAVKVSSGPTDDDEADRRLPIWAGLVPVVATYGTPVPFEDGGDATLPLPASVRRLLGRP